MGRRWGLELRSGWVGETKGGGQLWDGITSRHQADVTSAIAALLIQPDSLSLTIDKVIHFGTFRTFQDKQPHLASTSVTTGSFVFEGKGIAPKLEPYQPESRLDNKDYSTTVVVFLLQMETKVDPIKPSHKVARYQNRSDIPCHDPHLPCLTQPHFVVIDNPRNIRSKQKYLLDKT